MVTWRVDSCGCQVSIHQDVNSPNGWTVDQVLNICAIHVDEPTNADLLNALLNDNRRKNYARDEILTNLPEAATQSDTNGIKTFKDGSYITWSWSGNRPIRTLTITLIGQSLNNNQRNSIQAKLDARFPNQNIIFQTG